LGAARLRTLPLSVSGIIVGAALVKPDALFDHNTFWLAILTTIAFQITSNFANDYGDGVKGTDSQDRIGPKRALQSGALSRRQLSIGIFIASAISFVLTIWVVIRAFGSENLGYALLFIVLGILSIWAAIKYTVGESAYGYHGLGDVFVFLFFGILAVMGTKFLFTKSIELLDLLPAMGVGFLCTGVLNLNNLRDLRSDKEHKKNTLIVKMGYSWGKRYHYLLLTLGFLCFSVFTILSVSGGYSFMYLILFLLIAKHLFTVVQNSNPKDLDPELKKLALGTFAIAMGFYITMNNFL